jgi:hypothetical protein
MSEWRDRKRRGYPWREDWQSGRCLGPDQLRALQHGDEVMITWGGGNGPHRYSCHRTEDGMVLADRPGSGLPPGYPGTIFDPERDQGAKGLLLWVEALSTTPADR